MKLGKVIGNVWAVRKVPELEGCRLNLVQFMTDEGTDDGHPQVVADPEGIAGPGDTVMVVTNTDATQAFKDGTIAVNAAIVGRVESLD